MEIEKTPECLVLLVAGSRGLEDAATLLRGLSRQLTCPLLFLSNAGTRSTTSAIVQRAGDTPHIVVERKTSLEAGKIYLLAGDDDFLVSDGAIEVRKSTHPGGLERALASAAAAYGEHLTVVLLSPEGAEVAAGAVEVKRRQGLVILHDSRAESAMSTLLALPPTAYDDLRDLNQVKNLVIQLARRTSSSDGHEDALREILAHASRKASIDFRLYKPTTIVRRIDRRLAVTSAANLEAYAQLLSNDPLEVAALVSSFLIGVTEFFRDVEAYALLRTSVLPDLIEAGRARSKTLRIWSVGCATGEEPYSIAMLVAELLGEELADWSVKIFATDVSERAIDFARKGIYPANVIENVPWEYRTKHFSQTDDGFRISKGLRQLVIFGQQDLSRAAPFPRIDLVTCRNVMIYFKPELQQDVLDLFAYSLQAHHGFLFLGKAETVRPSKARYELLNKKWKVYRCLKGPQIPPSRTLRSHSRSVSSLEAPVRRSTEDLARIVEHDGSLAQFDIGQIRRFNEQLLRNLPVGVVLIDRSYRIVSVNNAARRALGIHESVHAQDFLHAARGIPYAEMRSAIDTVFRERTPHQMNEVTLESTATREPRFLQICVAPVIADHASADLLMISLFDITDRVEQKRLIEESQAQQKALFDQLEAANHRFSELNKELQEANEELQAANEEMMLAQEELQAANEELEATNEELQATNEELETNNEELQATNEELEATNDELSSRTQELAETARSFESERTRFAEMVELAPFHILVMRGPGLMIEAFNPRFAALFADRRALGRAVDDVFPEPEMADLLISAHEAYRTDSSREMTSHLSIFKEGLTHLRCSLVPMHDHTGKVDGVALYAKDIEEPQKA